MNNEKGRHKKSAGEAAYLWISNKSLVAVHALRVSRRRVLALGCFGLLLLLLLVVGGILLMMTTHVYGIPPFLYPLYLKIKESTRPNPHATRPYLRPPQQQQQQADSNDASPTTCRDFFTVLPVGSFDSNKSESCKTLFESYHEQFRVISQRMEAMGAILYVYSDFADTETVCSMEEFANVQSVRFDPRDLFLQSFEKDQQQQVYETIRQHWSKQYVRISDVFRILLAREHGHSYLDPDVVFLSGQTKKETFLHPYVGVSVFRDDRNALEITNAAFCLSTPVLDRMMEFVRNRVLEGPSQYFYTEMGPSLFHKVLFNAQPPPVALYSVNHPTMANVGQLATEAVAYGHLLLHLTGHVRKANRFRSYVELVEEIEELIQEERRKMPFLP